MSIAADLRTYLLGDSNLTAKVSTRIYPLHLPQDATLPAIIYRWVSDTEGFNLDGADGLVSPRIQFDVFSETYTEMETVSDLLKTRLNGFRGTIASSPPRQIQGIFFDSTRDFFEEGGDQGSGSGVGMYRRSTDYFVHYFG